MYFSSYRIFVLTKNNIEKVLKVISAESIFVEVKYYNYGADIRASSSNPEKLEKYSENIKSKFGFFIIHDKYGQFQDLELSGIAGGLLRENGYMIVTAESCTGGLIAGRLSDIPGSSGYFWGGYVTYDNRAKIRLGVNPETLENYGAVSEETVLEMAEKALLESDADVSIAVTGVAGPGGGSIAKPVGTVWFAFMSAAEKQALVFNFSGDRKTVREKASETALLIVCRKILDNVGVDSIKSGDYI